MGRTKTKIAALGILLSPLHATATDYAPGEKLTLFHCGRCHVINEKNKYGGIGSTPSFGALRTMEDWEDRIMPIHLIYADGRQASAKVRAFVDHATEKLRNQSFG